LQASIGVFDACPSGAEVLVHGFDGEIFLASVFLCLSECASEVQVIDSIVISSIRVEGQSRVRRISVGMDDILQ
jgi:hypothetical protein